MSGTCPICGGSGVKPSVSQEAMDWAGQEVADIERMRAEGVEIPTRPFAELRSEVERREGVVSMRDRVAATLREQWLADEKRRLAICGPEGQLADKDWSSRWADAVLAKHDARLAELEASRTNLLTQLAAIARRDLDNPPEAMRARVERLEEALREARTILIYDEIPPEHPALKQIEAALAKESP